MAFRYDLKPLQTKEHLLVYLGAEEFWFDLAINFDANIYSQRDTVENGRAISVPVFLMHQIPKKNPNLGYRTVWEAHGELRNIYKASARRLTHFFEYAMPGFPHDSCFGYVRGKNIRDNAKPHLGATQLLKADMKEFFPSISQARVQKFFCELGVRDEIATYLSKFLTIDARLPLGLPTSPIIANAICHQLDIDMDNLASATGCAYSRYADDLTFSTKKVLPEISEIQRIVEAHGFLLSPGKTRSIKRGQNFYVTGLSVSDPSAPHAPRAMKRKLRQVLNFSTKYGLSGHLEHLDFCNDPIRQSYINYLDGTVKYIAFHEPNIADGIVTKWQKLLEESGDQASFEPKNQNSAGFEFYVDETEFVWEGNKYLALGMSASQHQREINDATVKVLDAFLANPLADGKLDAIIKNGLHFCDATEDLKKEYITALHKLPFNAYVVFGKIATSEEYEGLYLKLLSTIIKRRLMAAESLFANFYFEATDKVSKGAIEKLVRDSHGALVKAKNRHPRSVHVKFVDKNALGVSVPDFILGVFRKYIESGAPIDPPRREHLLFEYLRDKIRVVVNMDTAQEFTRRNPLIK